MSESVLRVRLQLLHSVTRSRASGWRCVCRFEGVTATDGAEVIGVEVQVEDRDHLDPGDVAECKLRFWAGEVLPLPIQPGTRLWLLEGAKEVATGEVL
jgi:hypothetical protein